MRNLVFLFFCLLTGLCSFSQNNNITIEQEKHEQLLALSTKTLVINIDGNSMNIIGEFKDEIIAWKEKVISVSINETSHIMTIIHFNLLDPKEMFDVMDKYAIKKGRIISYQ